MQFSRMSKSTQRLRDICGGLIALGGASLVCWQAVLIYYMIVGRIKVDEEHPPLIVIAAFIVIGVLLIAAGYRLTNPSVQKPANENE